MTSPDRGGETVVKEKATETPSDALTVSLDAPGMTSLHRVGVAGLWMTLEQLDGQPSLKKTILDAGGTWDREARSVTLRWSGESSAFFQALLIASFRLDSHGLVELTGLGALVSNAHKVLVQDALLETFLQHGKTRKAGPPTVLASGDEDAVDQPPLTYRPLEWYIHQRATKDLKPGKTMTLAGWNFPGGAVRHSGFTNDSALSEPLDRYLALLYAPVGAFFFRLRSRRLHRNPRFCLVLPDVTSLPPYSRARRNFAGYPDAQFIAAGGADASLRVALLLKAENLLDSLRTTSLRGIEFGRVAWDNKQKYRVGLFELTDAASDDLEPFRRAVQAFPTRAVKTPTGAFWSAAQVPELVATNLAQGQLWWRGFAEFVNDADRLKAVFGFERKGLATMMPTLADHSGSALGQGSAEVFVDACHAAWRRRLGALLDRAEKEHLNASALIGREFDGQRIVFARCKTSATLRAAVTDFWARGGRSLAPLQTGWRDVLPLLGEAHWQEGRDLALLALASYSAATKEEAEVLETAASSVNTVGAQEDPKEE